MENQNRNSLITRKKSRRRFLQQLGGGLAALAAPLQAQHPKRPFAKRAAGIPQINHIICLCQENHSFDHYFGSYSGLPSGYGIPAGYTSSGHAPFHFTTLTDDGNDPNHDWNAIHTGYANGKMNGWYAAGGIDTMGYYDSTDLAYYYSLFPDYTLCANYCGGMLSETQPNRMIYYSGTSGGNCCDCIETNGTLDSSTYPCILDLLTTYGITFANYNFGVPANYCYLALWSKWATGGPGNVLNKTEAQFTSDCNNNTLPQVVFITNESPNDEHPPEDVQTGMGQMQTIIETVQGSPVWASSAILLTWDEGGGFFDHIAPQQLDGYGPGVRVPMIVVSPFAKKGYVDTVFQDHGSFLKFIEAVYGLPTLASINHTFDTSTPTTNNSTAGLPFPPRDGNAATGNLTQCFTFTSSPMFALSANPLSVSVATGSSGTTTITSTVSGGFSSAVALTASGMPTGVTASFSPATIASPGSGASTLTLTASSSAAAGTYTITVTGTGGGLTETTTFALTVTAPSFTLSASPASVTVDQGSSGTSTITSTVAGGFSSKVTLSATGMPTGVTASFSPASIASPGSGTSTLTLTATSSAAVGAYTITITGTGGGVTETTTVALTVSSSTSPSFTLAANPTSVTAQQGTAATTTITSTINGGFSSAVALSASGMPTGVTASFSPASIASPGSGSSTLTLTATSSAAVGTYTITITGTGGGVTATTTVSFAVTSGSSPSFTLTPSPASVTVQQGSSGTSVITATTSGGFSSAIAMSSSGAPAGVTVSFNPTSIPSPGSGSTTMTLAVASSAAAGTYTINVIGTGAAGIVGNTAVSLTVTSTTGSNLVKNGGFETGSLASWTAVGKIKPTASSAQAHSGSHSALLGQTATPEVDGNSSIHQAIAIPSTANTATLTFWYWPSTDDTITYAYQEVLIQSSAGKKLASVLKVASNAKAWTQVTFDLTPYKGETVRLFFAVHGNGYAKDYIYMYVDDVSVTVQ